MDYCTQCEAILEAVGHITDSDAVVGFELALEPGQKGVRTDVADGSGVAVAATPFLAGRFQVMLGGRALL